MSLIRPSTYSCNTLASWVEILIIITKSNRLSFTATGIGLASMALLCLGESGVTLEPPAQKVAQIPLANRTMSQGNVLFVNPAVGNETIGNGSVGAPFKTITQALRVAQPNSVIVLSNGTYSTSSGEKFPLMLKPGVSIQGDPGTRGGNTVIQGGGTFLSPTFARQNITILGANSSGVTGVTVTNPNPRGYGLWIESSSPLVTDNTFTRNSHDGISITGNSAPTIRSNYFYQNGANGMTIYGTSRPEVRENVFEKTGFGINIAQKAVPVLIGNRITQNRAGIVAQANARPILRSNVIEDNTEDGVVVIATSQPDLGTATEPGGNVFRQNGRYDINSRASSQVIPAFGNQLVLARTTGSIDLAGTVSSVAQGNQPPSNPNLARNPPATSANVSGELTRQPMPLPSATSVPERSLFSASSFPTPSSLVRSGVTTPNATTTDGRWTPTPFSQPSFSTVAQRTTPVELPVLQPEPAQLSQSTGEEARAMTTMAPIEIPVPPPASTEQVPPTLNSPPQKLNFIQITSLTPNQSEDSAPASSSKNQLAPVSTSATAMEIPIPPTASIPVPPPPAQTGSTGKTLPVLEPAPIVASELLPVPSRNIPIGNTRKLPKVRRSQSSLAPSASSSPLPPTGGTSLGLRYRVVVEAESESKQALVRSLVPGAFRTFSNGRVLMQAGSFSDHANADEIRQLLTSKGLRAAIEQMQ